MDNSENSLPKNWLPEFNRHYFRLPKYLQEEISKNIFPLYNSQPGIYEFAQFWYNQILNWTGILEPELVYLAVKALVFAGLDKKALIVGRGYNYHAGCAAWIAGAQYKKSNGKSKIFLNLLNDVELIPTWKDDPYVFTDWIAWKIAYEPSTDKIIELYNQNKQWFMNGFPLYLLLDRLIKGHQIRLIREFLNQTSDFKGNRIIKLFFLHEEAVFFQILGDHDNSFLFFDMALENALEIFDFHTAAKISFNQGALCFHQGNYKQAIHQFEKSEKFYRYVKDQVGLGKVYYNLSSVYNAQGDYIKAETSLTIASKYLSGTNLKSMVNSIKTKKANLLKVKGKYNKAFKFYKQSLISKDNVVNIEILLQMGLIHQELGEYPKGLLVMEQAYQQSKKLGYTFGQANAELRMGQILLHQGKIAEARKRLYSVKELNHHLKNLTGYLKTIGLLAYIDILNDEIDSAESQLLNMLGQARRKNKFMEEVCALNLLAEVHLYKANHEKSKILLQTAGRILKKREVKNYLFFNNKIIQIRSNQYNSSYLDENLLQIIELKQIGLQVGSKLWVNKALFLEGRLRLRRGDINQCKELCSSILSDNELSYELEMRTKLLLIEADLSELKKLHFPSEMGLKLVENNLHELINKCLESGTIFWLLEAKYCLIMLSLIKKDVDLAKIEIQSAMDLINESMLLLYKNQFDELIKWWESLKEGKKYENDAFNIKYEIILPHFS